MANKKLSYDQIAERGLFDPLLKEINSVDQALSETAKNLKDFAKLNAEIAKQTPLDSYKNIEKVEDAVKETTKAVKELDKVEKDRIKLQERLAALEDDRAKANAELREQIRRKNKELRDEARLNAETSNGYEKANQRLVKLRKEYKRVAFEQGRNSEAAKELRGEMAELSETLEQVDRDMKQQFREIGRYENAVNKLSGAFRGLAGAAVIVKLLEKFGEALNTNRETSDLLAKGIGRITVTVTVLVSRIAKIIPALGNIFEQVQIKVQRFFVSIQRGFADLPEVFGGGVDKAAELDAQLAKLDARAAQLSGGGVDALKGAFTGIGAEISDLIEKNDNLIDATTRYEKRAITLQKELADLIKTQGLLQVAADDDTQSLRDQEQAALDLLEVNEQIAQKNIELAQNELERTRQAAVVRKGDLEAQKEYAAAYTAYQEAVAQGAVASAEVEAQVQKIRRDQLETELDILFDVSDRRKTVGEQQIADERINLERRKAILEETVTDIEGTYGEITDLINEFSGEAIDLDSLLSIEDTTELNRAINELDIDEITRNRLREALIERLQAVEDLNQARKDLLDTETDYLKVTEDIAIQEQLLADIEAGRIEGAVVLEKLEERRRELQIENLRAEIEAAEEGSTRRAELQQQLNDILLEQVQERADKQAEEEEKARQKQLDEDQKQAERRAEIQRELYNLLSDLSSGYFEQEAERLNEQLEQSQEREAQLREAAQEGIQNATENLAVEQQRQVEIQAQQAEVERRKRLAELFSTVIQIYQSKVAAGDESPLASTATDISGLKALLGSLQGFYEGSERVGDDLKPVLSGRDGHVIRVDGGERIISSRENSLIPRGMSNFELAMLANSPLSPAPSLDIMPLRKDLQAVKQAIENKPAYMGTDFDAYNKALSTLVEKKGRRVRTHRKVGGVFGG